MITAARARELLSYDPDTGVLTWRSARNWRAHGGLGKYAHLDAQRSGMPGQLAGTLRKDGYVEVTVRGKQHRAHRLAWLIVYGKWPEGQIDHKNRNRSDNRIDNLREANNQQNQWNRECQKNNFSGLKGVSMVKLKPRTKWKRTPVKPWEARIKVNGKTKVLGRYVTKEEAALAYIEASQRVHGEFSKGV